MKENKSNNQHMWQGVIIEESFENKSILDMVEIVATKVSKLENENRVMTFHDVEVSDSAKDEYVEKAQSGIKQGFYTHLCKDGKMVVIFRDKVFTFGESDPELIEAREYGKSIGIIPKQMPFEHLVNNPFD